MKVAIITPYYKESNEVLQRCMESVWNQTHKDIMHVMVADGHPNQMVEHCTEHHIVTPPCADTGSTPRLMGCAYASAKGADAMILLDADCWLEPRHVEILLMVLERSEGASIITYPRLVYTKDGSQVMGICSGSDGTTFNDTNCYFITRPAFHIMSSWGFQPLNWGLYSDRPVWAAAVNSNIPMVRTNSVMVNYPSDHIGHYRAFGFPIPDDAIEIRDKEGVAYKVTYRQIKEQS